MILLRLVANEELFLAFSEAVTPEWYAVLSRVVACGELFVGEDFEVLTGWRGVDAFTSTGRQRFARFAHLIPQYGCTTAPSFHLGLSLQCFEGVYPSAISQQPSERARSQCTLGGQELVSYLRLCYQRYLGWFARSSMKHTHWNKTNGGPLFLDPAFAGGTDISAYMRMRRVRPAHNPRD